MTYLYRPQYSFIESLYFVADWKYDGQEMNQLRIHKVNKREKPKHLVAFGVLLVFILRQDPIL